MKEALDDSTRKCYDKKYDAEDILCNDTRRGFFCAYLQQGQLRYTVLISSNCKNDKREKQ